MKNEIDITSQILDKLEDYQLCLINQGAQQPKRFPLKKNLSEATKLEIMQHTHYLILQAKETKKDKNFFAILNQRLGAIQTLLSFAGLFSILDTMYDNKKK